MLYDLLESWYHGKTVESGKEAVAAGFEDDNEDVAVEIMLSLRPPNHKVAWNLGGCQSAFPTVRHS